MCKSEKVFSESEKKALLLTLARTGHTKPKHWKLIHKEICKEDELEFNTKSLLKKLSRKFQFVVDVVSNPNQTSRLDRGVLKVRYRYVLHPRIVGLPVLIPTSREFCVVLINQNKIYRLEDIDQMSFRGSNPDFNAPNYSIFRYKGSFGCRHAWQREVYLIERDNENVENNQIVERRILRGNTREFSQTKRKNNSTMSNKKTLAMKFKDLITGNKEKLSQAEKVELTELLVKADEHNSIDVKSGERTIRIEGEMAVGSMVAWLNEDGTLDPIEDGEYEVDGQILVIANNTISDILTKEDPNAEEASEFNAEEQYNSLAKDIKSIKEMFAELSETNEAKSKETATELKELIETKLAEVKTEIDKIPALEKTTKQNFSHDKPKPVNRYAMERSKR